jgi:chemotaxis protein methyltransferase CheR
MDVPASAGPAPAAPVARNATAMSIADSVQEFTLTAPDFDRIRKLIYQRAGISLHAGKQAMVYSRLSRRLRETGHRDFGSYLSAGAGRAGLRRMAGVRELPDHQPDRLLPRGASLPRAGGGPAARASRPLRIWCNAASTGEEPYSLAMTVVETLGCRRRSSCCAATSTPRCWPPPASGVYDAEARGLSPERLRRHFLRGTGPNAGRIRVKPELARMIEFRSLQPDEPRAGRQLGEPFDLVFCRNVMIYFDAPTQRKVLERSTAPCARAGCSTSATRRTSPSRPTCSACAARRSTSASDPPARSSPGNRGRNQDMSASPPSPRVPVPRVPWPPVSPRKRLKAQPRRPGEASFFFYDAHFRNEAVKVLPGEYFVHDEDLLIMTTLGSCIAACLWDRERASAA